MGDSLFISDLHLSAERPGTVERFLRFLQGPTLRGARLYILGDLFDVWIGDDNRADPIPRVEAALRAAAGSGTEVLVMHGNRDFLIGEGFCAGTGCRLLGDPTLIDLGGTPTLLMHGDLLCSDDLQYQAARRQLRVPAVIADFLAKPLEQRAVIAAEIRRKSGETTSLLAKEIMDVNPQTVLEYMQHHGAQRLIHGHTHRPAVHRMELDGAALERIVLAEWGDQGASYLRVGSDGVLETIAIP